MNDHYIHKTGAESIEYHTGAEAAAAGAGTGAGITGHRGTLSRSHYATVQYVTQIHFYGKLVLLWNPGPEVV